MLDLFVPKMKVDSIYEIDLEALLDQGFRGIITDLDNTLVGAREPEATPQLLEWLKILDKHGFRVVIVSNNRQPRVERFAKPLGMPFVYKAKKPLRTSFKKALQLLDLPPQQVVVIGDQMMTDVFGGNRMGLFTILVQPIAPQDEGFGTRINRTLERFLQTFMNQ